MPSHSLGRSFESNSVTWFLKRRNRAWLRSRIRSPMRRLYWRRTSPEKKSVESARRLVESAVAQNQSPVSISFAKPFSTTGNFLFQNDIHQKHGRTFQSFSHQLRFQSEESSPSLSFRSLSFNCLEHSADLLSHAIETESTLCICIFYQVKIM